MIETRDDNDALHRKNERFSTVIQCTMNRDTDGNTFRIQFSLMHTQRTCDSLLLGKCTLYDVHTTYLDNFSHHLVCIDTQSKSIS